MKLVIKATKKRLEQARDKKYVVFSMDNNWSKEWWVIVPLSYFAWPTFEVEKWNKTLGSKGLFLVGEWYVCKTKSRAYALGVSNDPGEVVNFEFIF